MSRRVGFTAAAALVLAIAACKAFGADDGDEDPPTQPTPPAREASTLEASVVPIPTEGYVPPLESVLDASVDATTVADAFAEISAYGTFDNFERPNPLVGSPFNWNMKGVIARAGCPGVADCSPDAALSLWVHAGDPPVMLADTEKSARVLRYDFAMRTDAHGRTISHAQIASIAISRSRNIYLEVRGGKLRIGDQKKVGDPHVYDSQEIDLANHISDAWVRYRILADFDRNLAGVWRNGVVIGVKQLRPFITEPPFAVEEIRLGTAYWDGQNEFDIYVDDVGKLETKPGP